MGGLQINGLYHFSWAYPQGYSRGMGTSECVCPTKKKPGQGTVRPAGLKTCRARPRSGR